jgi:hypothetical protein
MVKMLLRGMLLASLVVLPALPSQAQLVMVHKDFRIVQVDTVHNRLVVAKTDGGGTQLFVDCNGTTRVFFHGRQVAWQSLMPGDVVKVDSGLKWSAQFAAKTIIVEHGRVMD